VINSLCQVYTAWTSPSGSLKLYTFWTLVDVNDIDDLLSFRIGTFVCLVQNYLIYAELTLYNFHGRVLI